MKLSVAIFFAGFFGALGVLIFLVAFGTDYWLLATEKCGASAAGPNSAEVVYGSGDTDTSEPAVTFHHEGFFWRCWFNESKADDSIWKFWFANQPPKKSCMHAYLFPFPVDTEVSNTTARETAVIYRGFWTVFMILGVVAIVAAGFLIICAAPFASHRLYKAGGGLFIAAGILFAVLVVMYVIWVQTLADMETYIRVQRIQRCSDFSIHVRYGWSFILAPIGIFFSLFSGMLFLLVGRVIQLHTK